MTDWLTIGVDPSETLEERGRLFRALESVFSIRFIPAEAGRCDGYIAFGSGDLTDHDLQCGRILRYPVLKAFRSRPVGDVTFNDCKWLDERLRRRTLHESTASRTTPGSLEGVVLAQDSKCRPLWVKRFDGRKRVDEVALAPPDIQPGEALRDHLVPGRFIALLPIVHFLREIEDSRNLSLWRPPKLRATFVLDDPNLHWRSYGALKYNRLARSATDVQYHVTIATIPVDAWFTHEETARIFRNHAKHLSLTVHGNDHRRDELAQLRSEAQARAVLAQALRRTTGLENRSGLKVGRVMIPPHEACSEVALKAMMDLGYDAISMTRPHPWISLADQSSAFANSAENLAAGWFPAEMRDDGFPVLTRRGFQEVDEIHLRAYLNQPLIFYGHAKDLRDGLTPLENAAAHINSYNGVQWDSLTNIAKSNYETRHRRAGLLEVRPFSRKFLVDDLADANEVQIDWNHPGAVRIRLVAMTVDGTAHISVRDASESIKVSEKTSRIEVTLLPPTMSDINEVPSPPLNPIVVGRRVLTELRDRITR